jgi:hypothetical protein
MMTQTCGRVQKILKLHSSLSHRMLAENAAALQLPLSLDAASIVFKPFVQTQWRGLIASHSHIDEFYAQGECHCKIDGALRDMLADTVRNKDNAD